MIFFSNKNRPYEMGPYPLERLGHDMGIVEMETVAVRKPRPADLEPDQKSHFSIAVDKYHGVFSKLGRRRSVAAGGAGAGRFGAADHGR